MLATVNTMTSFSEWLLEILEERGWSQARLADAAGIGRASISDIISGRRKVGTDVASAIAVALKLPHEQVFRAAGLLPPEPDEDPWIESTAHKLRQLSPQLRSVADRLIESLIQEEESHHKAKPKTRSAKA